MMESKKTLWIAIAFLLLIAVGRPIVMHYAQGYMESVLSNIDSFLNQSIYQNAGELESLLNFVR